MRLTEYFLLLADAPVEEQVARIEGVRDSRVDSVLIEETAMHIAAGLEEAHQADAFVIAGLMTYMSRRDKVATLCGLHEYVAPLDDAPAADANYDEIGTVADYRQDLVDEYNGKRVGDETMALVYNLKLPPPTMLN